MLHFIAGRSAGTCSPSRTSCELHAPCGKRVPLQQRWSELVKGPICLALGPHPVTCAWVHELHRMSLSTVV